VRRDIEQSVRNAALVRQLEDLVIHDQLTGAYSRSYLFQQMEQQVAQRRRHGDNACVIMLDLDHFKQVNDRYGHPAGDRVLVHAVQQVNQQLREGDVLARVGGEEFMVLLPGTGQSDAVQIAERLRRVMAEAWVAEGESRIHMPASFGVAELRSTESQSEWFRRADHALYQAKDQGRNRVVVAE
jgi:diguanylate cyclase